MENFVAKFKTASTPNKPISINEELLLWKRCLGFKQCILSKRAGCGIKMFSVCQVSSYLWNSFVYIGKYAVETPVEQALVKQLGEKQRCCFTVDE